MTYLDSARRRSFADGGLAVVLMCSLGVVLCGCGEPAPKPLGGKLTVLVRPVDRTLEPIPVEQAGAAPVQSGGAMCLDAQLDEPAFAYLVWIDAEGKVLPLYPWNNERLEITDVDSPPPVRRAGKLVFSPLLGNSWTFGKTPGTETVILLARRTALPESTKLGELLQSVPTNSATESAERVVSTRLDVRTKGGSSTAIARANDPALTAALNPLHEHFDLIHAVQFRHAAEDGKSGGTGEK